MVAIHQNFCVLKVDHSLLSRMIFFHDDLSFSSFEAKSSVSFWMICLFVQYLTGFRLMIVTILPSLLMYSCMASAKCLSESEMLRMVMFIIDLNNRQSMKFICIFTHKYIYSSFLVSEMIP